MGVDRNTIIGILLMTSLFFLYMQLQAPNKEQIARQKFVQDSIANVALQTNSTQKADVAPQGTVATDKTVITPQDSATLGNNFGSLAASALGTEQTYVLENELVKYTFSNKGGRIVDVAIKKYNKITADSNHVESKDLVHLLEDKSNRFEYLLPVNGVAKPVSTQDLYFAAQSTAKDAVSFKVSNPAGGFFEQSYQLAPDDYTLQYKVNTNNLLKDDAKLVTLNWVNHLDRIELNTNYEKNYSSVYFRKVEGKVDYCSCTKDDSEELSDSKIEWISHGQQFFNTSLIASAAAPFASGTLSTAMTTDDNPNLKVASTLLRVPIGENGFSGKIYAGPNEFKRLRAFKVGLEDIIPYGSSILGTINRWIIRPIFLFLSSFIGSAGLVILLLTLFVKLVTYPLSYKMIMSQAKMSALKPRIDKLKAKLGTDNPQEIQTETMKLYNEFGVNPLGGCLPMLVQMPIWLALYRFFPAAIEFRQASFLWINDLTNYETFLRLPFNVPFLGQTLGLFALLWTITTLVYSFYSTKDMDFSSNPAMKYMQYITPFIFFPFFNTTAAGLSFYMAMSNMINIGQTIVTRKFIIDDSKVLSKLEANKAAPKKKSGFRAKFDQLMAEAENQKKLQEQAKKKK